MKYTKRLIRPILYFLLLTPMIVLMATVLSHHNPPRLHYSSFDMCWLRMVADTARLYGASYQIDDGYDMPMMIIEHDQSTLDKISADLNNASSTPYPPQKICHLPHVKYHANNANPKLIPHIPDDIDYISYAPPSIGEHKAVYCYYDFTPKQTHSKCYFIKLDETHHLITTDDISDIQDHHITQIKRQYIKYDTHTYHSYVSDWYDHKHLVYGMSLPAGQTCFGGYQ